MAEPEVFLRGPLPGVPSELQPVMHSLMQSQLELRALLHGLDVATLNARAGSSASIAFHVLHCCGSLDRLLTYARDEALNEQQWQQIRREQATSSDESAGALLELVESTFAAALAQVRATDPATLDEARGVGRARLPSTVRGLLFHAAEHTLRHAGQVATLRRVLLA